MNQKYYPPPPHDQTLDHRQDNIGAPIQEKNRIEFFDLAKGICIFLVVLYHISQYYGIELPAKNCIKSIRLPLYFFLSGCFFKTYGGFWDFIKRKCNKLLLPFLFWFFFSLLLAYILLCFGMELFSYYNLTIQSLYHNTIYGSYPDAPIWFLLCLFWVNIVFYVVHLFSCKLNKKYQPYAIGVISLLSGMVGVSLSTFKIGIPFYIGSAFSAMPFFAFGYFMFRYTLVAKANKYDKWIPLIVLVLLVFLYFCAPFYSLKRNTNINYSNFILVYLCGFVGALSIILISKYIKKIPLVSYWGRYSIMILVSHAIVYRALPLFILDTISVTYGFSNFAMFLINLVLTMAICTVLIPFFKKFMPHVTAQKDIIPVETTKTV